ncbi:hypothetical protein H6G54_19910 [Anabaena cylindrica FACHB-243]|uniref:hypothetical protein n=1 Tax=Anabaena TaxID=1163 RepID=UPI0003195B85|nr:MULTISPECIES: hypothetical protein [Anabaena]MBD2419930.1 hypothetical protein [Anabaena cylindrica FACHB-243]MCM2407868.1 hypothetical protein [Anabaena sp. CCAP 1446/1C]
MTKQYSQQVLLDCVVEDSESAKQKTQVWQPGSALAQFGFKAAHKNFLNQKFLWKSVNHHSRWGCQN